ncbi:hypothetical protein DITRI_Ditri15bG0038700 [Diplodiscus trichospermus]
MVGEKAKVNRVRGLGKLEASEELKNICLSSDTRHRIARKAESPVIMSVVARTGTRNGLNIFVHRRMK